MAFAQVQRPADTPARLREGLQDCGALHSCNAARAPPDASYDERARLTRASRRGTYWGMTRFDVVAFDLYGTLLDVRGLAGVLEKHLGPSAGEILTRWRKAQL